VTVNSIGDFAESLILGQVEDIKQGKSLPPKLEEAKATANAPAKDISNIEVPNEMMREILGEGFHPQDTPPAETMPELVWNQPEPEPEPQVITEETAQELISLVEEVKGIVADLKEMTTAGALGVNLAGPCEDPMKKISSKGYRKPKSSRKSALKDAIKNRLR
jgi:hypothetical protein